MKTQIKTLSLFTATLCAASASAAPIAGGTTIGVDFGPTAPTNNFNHAAGPADGTIAAGDIIDTSAIVVDGVSFSWTNGEFRNDDAADSSDLPGQPSQFDDSNLTDWFVEGNANDMALAFAGLDDSLTYDLTIGSGFTGGVNTDTTWTADGQSATTVYNVGADAYVTLTGLSTDGSGNLVISAAGANADANFTAVSALELVAVVPEPSSLALLGLGGLLIARRRRG